MFYEKPKLLMVDFLALRRERQERSTLRNLHMRQDSCESKTKAIIPKPQMCLEEKKDNIALAQNSKIYVYVQNHGENT